VHNDFLNLLTSVVDPNPEPDRFGTTSFLPDPHHFCRIRIIFAESESISIPIPLLSKQLQNTVQNIESYDTYDDEEKLKECKLAPMLK
jgi:hypothetical protein